MPEEINRKVVGLCAELHFAPTERAALNLVYEGISPEKIFVTGNTVVDVCHFFSKIAEQKSTILRDLDIQKNKKLIVVTAHRPENVDNENNLRNIIDGIVELGNDGYQIVFSVHPRTRKMLDKMQLDLTSIEFLILIEPVGYLDFLQLLKNADLVITDSGGVQEEALTLKCPCLTIRSNTERPETVEVGANILVGTKKNLLLKYARKILSDELFSSKMRPSFNPLGDGHAGEKIVKIARERCSNGIKIESPIFLESLPKTFKLLRVPESWEGLSLEELKKKIPEFNVTLIYDHEGRPIFPQNDLILRKNWSIRIMGSY
jgi:UDP-N-acetylglucosamine 2-epimerase (non-hydrolysing)